LNKNLICLTAISFLIEKKLVKDSDIAPEIMSKLHGSNPNFEDTLFNDE
jgi:hypothetical protein